MEDAGFKASFLQGIRQGFSCAICCAGSMLLLVALGAMNLYLMFAVGVVIALEKLLLKPQPVIYGTGSLALFLGMVQLIRSLM
jgi:predicted metal-binding membrane protein